MVVDAKWAVRASLALSLRSMLASIHGVVVAWSAEVLVASAAKEEGDGAAVLALEVDELVSVLFAEVLSEAKGLLGAILAQ